MNVGLPVGGVQLWIKVAAGVLAAVLLLPALQLYLATHPPKLESQHTPEDLGLAYEPVRLTTSDGLELAAWWIPAANASQADTALVVGHGYPADKGDVLPGVAFLHERYHLLLFDHRSFGQSEGSMTTVGLREVLDVRAAVDHASARPSVEHVAGIGFSMSAATMLLTQDPRMEALVAEAGFARLDLLIDQLYPLPWFTDAPLVWLTEGYARLTLGTWPSQIAPEAAIGSTAFPVLLIHGTEDDQIPVSHAHWLHAAAPAGASELYLVEGAGHGQAHAVAGEAYEDRVLAFLTDHVDGPRAG